MIHIDNVTFRYPGGTRPAIQELSLTIGRGERVCVLGANGSGKSTFARLIAGLETPASGGLLVDGQEPAKAAVGFLFQNVDNQIVAATVDKEIAFALENDAVDAEEMQERVESAISRFGIETLSKRLTTELSGGEKQRVALASIMVTNPAVLVLDEPDSNLDMGGRRLLRDNLNRLYADLPQLTEIRITQYPTVAEDYQRVLIFDTGKLIADGEPASILTSGSYQPDRLEELGLADYGERLNPGEKIGKVVFDRVHFGYESAPVIADLSFEIKTGQTLGVVGPSGCGKSTLIGLLTGLIETDSGSIGYFDRGGRPVRQSQIAGSVTAVLQQPERQFFLPTCANEVVFGPKNLGRPMSGDAARSLIEAVGLDPEMARRDPFSLSGGEKRRLAFAVALSLQPDIIAFDEPISALDREGVGRFIALSELLRNAGAGQLIVSHDGEVIEKLTDRVLVLRTDRHYQIVTTPEFFKSDSAGEFLSMDHVKRQTSKRDS